LRVRIINKENELLEFNNAKKVTLSNDTIIVYDRHGEKHRFKDFKDFEIIDTELEIIEN